MSDGAKESSVVEPVHPNEGSILDGVHRLPRALSMDDFSLVQTIDRLGQRIVIGVTDTADGWLET